MEHTEELISMLATMVIVFATMNICDLLENRKKNKH